MELNVEQIIEILPHRAPFLLVDKITEREPVKYAVGYKNITFNEPQFAGHFPGKPVMPGVLLVEAMAQVGGVCMLCAEEHRGKIPFFGAIDNVKFKRPVVPGDKVVMRAEVTKVKGNFGKVHAEAFVDDQLAAQADLTYALQAPIKEEEK